MREPFPLASAWRVLARWPALFLIPFAWDLAKWLLGAVFSQAGLYFARWDFTVGVDYEAASWTARIVLPPALPSAEHLGIPLSPAAPQAPGAIQLGAMLLVLALDSLAKAGFLNLLNGTLHGVAPTANGFLRGARRFGGRLFVIALIWMGCHSGLLTLAARGSLSTALMTPLVVILVALLAAAEFIVVVEDAWPPMAILAAPILLFAEVGHFAAVIAYAGVASGLLTGLTDFFGVKWFLLLAPTFAFAGTLATAAVLQAFQLGISTRNERAGVSWACRECLSINAPGASECVACGRLPEEDSTHVGTAAPRDEEVSQGG